MTRSEQELNAAYGVLEQAAPDSLARALRRMRDPRARWVRIPLGLFFVACSCVWFLPVVGIEFLPIGLLLLSQDVPFLRKPTARFILWLERRWTALRRRWKHRRR